MKPDQNISSLIEAYIMRYNKISYNVKYIIWNNNNNNNEKLQIGKEFNEPKHVE